VTGTRQSAGDFRRWLTPVLQLGSGIRLGQGTTQRFVLLLVLFITGSVYMFGIIFQDFVDPRGYGGLCELAAGVDPFTDNPANGLNIVTPEFNDCLVLHASGWRYVWLPLAATALVVLLAMAHYALYPRWQRRRRHLVPLEAADPGRAVREALADLKSCTGITRELDYVVDLSAASPSARVFGRPGKYTVCLNAGLIALFGRDTDAFGATVLHEFAHIRNRDVGITYLTVAIWRVFLVCALTPFALTELFYIVSGLLVVRPSPFLRGEMPGWAGQVALAAFFGVLIYLAMADVLRSREHFADLDAVTLGADRVYWLRHVAAVPAGRNRFRIANELRAALRPHPSWEKRTAALIRPRDVYTTRAVSMFVTGAAVQFLLGLMGTAPEGMSYPWIQDNAIWPAAGLTTAVAGFAVWRNTTYEIRAGRSAPSGLRAGFWLGVGQLAGALLLSQANGNGWSPPFPWVLVSILLIVMPAAILWWTAGCASHWNRLGGLRGLAAGAATIATTTAAFAWWFLWWEANGTLYLLGNPDPASASFTDQLRGFPHTTTTEIIAIMIGPIADSLTNWGIWLTAALWILPLTAARPRSGYTIGVWSGCAAAVSVILITFRAHDWNGHGILTSSQNFFIYGAWVIGIILCATVAAIILASLRGNGRVAPAMTASGITVVLGSAAVVATFGSDGCLGPLAITYNHCVIADSLNAGWSEYSDLFGLLLPGLGIFTLAVAAPVGAIVRMTSNGERWQSARTDPPAWPRRLTWIGWCAACLVLVGLSIPVYLYDASLGSTSTTSSEGPGQFEPAAPGAESAQLQTSQLEAWWGLGGENIIDQFGNDAGKLAALDANETVRASESENKCSTIMSLVVDAQAYLPPPEPLILQSWSSAIGEASTGARECLAGLSRHDDSLVISGIAEIYGANNEMNNIIGQIGDDVNAS
jgi:Zn-dependent protease with chaperone function